ncbi:hypothetical protein EMCRGX_G034712 [Ephydatia muelleri]
MIKEHPKQSRLDFSSSDGVAYFSNIRNSEGIRTQGTDSEGIRAQEIDSEGIRAQGTDSEGIRVQGQTQRALGPRGHQCSGNRPRGHQGRLRGRQGSVHLSLDSHRNKCTGTQISSN